VIDSLLMVGWFFYLLFGGGGNRREKRDRKKGTKMAFKEDSRRAQVAKANAETAVNRSVFPYSM